MATYATNEPHSSQRNQITAQQEPSRLGNRSSAPGAVGAEPVGALGEAGLGLAAHRPRSWQVD